MNDTATLPPKGQSVSSSLERIMKLENDSIAAPSSTRSIAKSPKQEEIKISKMPFSMGLIKAPEPPTKTDSARYGQDAVKTSERPSIVFSGAAALSRKPTVLLGGAENKDQTFAEIYSIHKNNIQSSKASLAP